MRPSRIRYISGCVSLLGVFFASLLALRPVCVSAQVPDTFENSGNYVDTGIPINATNFVNDGSGNFTVFSPNDGGTVSLGNGGNGTITFQPGFLQAIYDNWNDVLNFTNNGIMSSTGFRFDTQTTNHVGALNVNNAGTISTTLGLYVLATNFINSGTISGQDNGLFYAIAQIMDLSDSTLYMKVPLSQPAYGNTAGFQEYGLNTNFWDPSILFTSTNAQIWPPIKFQYPAFPYVNIVSNYLGSNTLIQVVYLDNIETDSVPSVYFSPSTDGSKDLASIEWQNSFFDYPSQSEITNYLVFTDNYSLAVTTNVSLSANGIPNNFSYSSSLDIQPTISGTIQTNTGFPTGFSFIPGPITNMYSYVDSDIIPTTADLNNVGNLALTNIAGRIQLVAGNTLNVSGAYISGANYISIHATNQFIDDGSASITAPYSDLYLGSTNGSLVLTNITLSTFAAWNGEITAASTAWAVTNLAGFTNYYEVVIVTADLSPKFNDEHQDVQLYASGNITICDPLTIIREFSTTATNLVIETNNTLAGAFAPQGELVIYPDTYTWQQENPNLTTLTNYGLIETMDLTTFGASTNRYISFVNYGQIYNEAGTVINANDFENYGSISAGSGSFTLHSGNTYLTSGFIQAGASIAFDVNSIVFAGQNLDASQQLNLFATNSLGDLGGGSGNFWSVGSGYAGFGTVFGLTMTSKPATGDLLGTTISLESPGAQVKNTWAGIDYGASTLGYNNNEAVGQLFLDPTKNGPHLGKFFFNPAGAANAIYIDDLEFLDLATNGVTSAYNYDFSTWLTINPGMTVYFARAAVNGVDVSAQIDSASQSGKNSGRLRWVPAYAGFFSSVTVTNSDGSTMLVNAEIAQSTNIDSNGNGIPNATDPVPFFSTADVHFSVQLTNLPPLAAQLTWHSFPGTTNVVSYRTSLTSTNWMVLTNFANATNIPPVGGWPITNRITDYIDPSQPHYYRVAIIPNNRITYGQ